MCEKGLSLNDSFNNSREGIAGLLGLHENSLF